MKKIELIEVKGIGQARFTELKEKGYTYISDLPLPNDELIAIGFTPKQIASINELIASSVAESVQVEVNNGVTMYDCKDDKKIIQFDILSGDKRNNKVIWREGDPSAKYGYGSYISFRTISLENKGEKDGIVDFMINIGQSVNRAKLPKEDYTLFVKAVAKAGSINYTGNRVSGASGLMSRAGAAIKGAVSKALGGCKGGCGR